MMKRALQQTVLVMSLLCLAAGVQAAGKKPEPVLRQPLMEPLVPHALIREAGWTYQWQLNLPIRSDEQVDRIFVHNAYLYVLTDTNILFCINRRQGRVLYTAGIAERKLPVCSPIFYQGTLGFIAGNQIRVFNPANGLLRDAEAIPQVGNIFECGVARNENYIYITGSDNRLHVISPDGYWQTFSVTADNDASINSVIARDTVVIFSTLAGNVVGMEPDAPTKIWQYDISGPIRAPLVAGEEFVYVAGMDAKLYKLHQQTGTMAWSQPFHTGAPVIDQPTLGRQVVYVYNDLNGLYAINREDGRAVWNSPDGKHALCESGDQAFVYARPGILKVISNKTGREAYTVNFSQVECYAENMTDAVMYVADKAGRVMSIAAEK